MSGMKMFSFCMAIALLAFGVDSLVDGRYGWATWHIGWAAFNFYLGVTRED